MYGSAQVAGRRERASRGDAARDMARVTEAAVAQSPRQAVENLIRATPGKSAKKKRQSVAFATSEDDDSISTSPQAIHNTNTAADIIAEQAARFAAERAAGFTQAPGDSISSSMWGSAKGATEAVAAAVANTSRDNAAHLISRAASAHAEHAADVAAAAAAHASAAAAAARDDPSPETEAEAQMAASIAREAADMATRAAAKATSAATRASADNVSRRIAVATAELDGFDAHREINRLRRSADAAAVAEQGLLPPTPPPRTRHTIMSEVYQNAARGAGGAASPGGRLPATPAHAASSRVAVVAAARGRRGLVSPTESPAAKTPGKLGISGHAARVPTGGGVRMTAEEARRYDLGAARRKLAAGSSSRVDTKVESKVESPAMKFKARPAPSYTKPRPQSAHVAARIASLRAEAPVSKKRDPLSFDSMADSALDRRHSRFEAGMVERERRIMNQIIHYNDDTSPAGTPTKTVKMHPWVGKSPEKKASESPGAHAGGLLGVHMPRPTKKSIAIAEAARQRRIDREVSEAMTAAEKQYGSPVERRGNPYAARSPGVALTKTAAMAPGSARRLMHEPPSRDTRVRLEKAYAEGRLTAARALLSELESGERTAAPEVADDDVWTLHARSREAVAALRGRL